MVGTGFCGSYRYVVVNARASTVVARLRPPGSSSSQAWCPATATIGVTPVSAVEELAFSVLMAIARSHHEQPDGGHSRRRCLAFQVLVEPLEVKFVCENAGSRVRSELDIAGARCGSSAMSPWSNEQPLWRLLDLDRPNSFRTCLPCNCRTSRLRAHRNIGRLRCSTRSNCFRDPSSTRRSPRESSLRAGSFRTPARRQGIKALAQRHGGEPLFDGFGASAAFTSGSSAPASSKAQPNC